MDPVNEAINDNTFPDDVCFTCNVSPKMAESRGRKQGWRETIDRLDAEISRLRDHYATNGWGWLTLDHIAGWNAAAEFLEAEKGDSQ